MSSHDLDFIEGVCTSRRDLVFLAVQRPQLPSPQTIAVAQVKQWHHVIVSHDAFLMGLPPDRTKHETDLVAKQMIAHVSVKGEEREIIVRPRRRPLGKIDW